MYKLEYIKENKNLIVISLFILFIAYVPFMNDFLLQGHDIGFHLGRIEGLAISLSNGDFLARVNAVNGNETESYEVSVVRGKRICK